MEKIKESLKNNQKSILLGALFMTAGIAVTYKMLKRTPGKVYREILRDKEFKTQNLPLYHTEGIERDSLISNVKYDLVLNFANQEGEKP